MIFLRNLQNGDAGFDVANLQRALRDLKYADFMPTGFFGDKTQASVKKFQADNNITPVAGYFGPKTRPVLLNKLSDLHRGIIYATAKSSVGIDVSPEDVIPDEYDCAETVCILLKLAGFSIGYFPLTTDLYHALIYSSDWMSVQNPLPGDVIISPTGMGNGSIPNGHVGIMDTDSMVMSNSSESGTLERHYTLSDWNHRYRDSGGYPVLFFRRL